MMKLPETEEVVAVKLEGIWDKWGDVATQAVSTIATIGQAILDVQKAKTDEMLAGIDAALEKQQEQIDKARQAELEAAGVAEATSEESLQAQIDAAKAAGDEVLQYQLSRRLEEKNINDKYDAQEKAAEEKAAREKADIQYKADTAQWEMDVINATNAGIIAVMQAWAQGGGLLGAVMAALVTAATAVQIGALAANPPKKPAFASGGIVGGRRADGDTQAINATAGELILNEAQQETTWNKMNSGGSGKTSLGKKIFGKPIIDDFDGLRY
jgi:hypothetical protein